MAEKTIKTKILLRYDVLSAWTTANPELKTGEVAIVAIPTDSNELNINGTTPPQILFKVGPGNFNDLPYASGKAADVYSWAKEASLSITKEGEGNVVSGIAWDPTANGGKGGIKFTTASVATSEGFEQVQARLAKLEAEVGDAANDYATSRIDSLEKTINDNSAAWAKDDNTTYAFEAVEKGFKVTPSAGEAQTFTFAYLTADEVADAIEAYGYATAESLNNYYTKTEIDNKGFLVASDIAGKADKTYVDDELAKKANASVLDSYYTKTEIDETVGDINEAIGLIEGDIDDLVERMDAVDGASGEIASIKGRLDTAEGNITTLSNNKADKSDLKDWELKSDADLVRGRVSTLEGHFGEEGRVTVAEGKISTLETKVGNLSGAFQFKGPADSVEALPAPSADNAGHVYLVGDLEYASNGTSWIQLGQNGDFVLDSIYQAHLTAQGAVDQGQSDKIAAIEKDIADNRAKWAEKTSVTDPTAGDGKITVDGVEMVVYDDSALTARVKSLEDNPYQLPSDVVRDENYKHITVTETSVSDGTTTFTKYNDTELAGRVTTVEGKVKTLEETTIPTLATKAEVKDAIDNSHTHSNKDVLDATTASFTTELKTKYDSYEGSISGVADRVTAVENEFKTVDDTKGKVVVLEEKVTALEAKPDITVTSTSVSDGTNTFTKYDDTELAGRVKAVEDNFADWAIIWDCGGASNN